jgi:hypothetical protein
MSDEKTYILGLLRFFWKKRLRARAAVHEICDIEGEGAVSHATAST